MLKRNQYKQITSGAGNGSATEAKQDAQITIATNTLNYLATQNRFNNGLTTTSFSAATIVLLNTAIQLFINANPTRRIQNLSHSQNGTTTFNALLIHSL